MLFVCLFWFVAVSGVTATKDLNFGLRLREEKRQCLIDWHSTERELGVVLKGKLFGLPCSVSRQHKFVYFLVPQSASSAVSDLTQRFGGHVYAECASVLYNLPDLHSYFLFTFVRDPIDRFLAALDTLHPLDAPEKYRLEEFYRPHSLKYINEPKQWIHQPKHQPQVLFLTTPTGAPHRLDFIGRVETLTEDWHWIERRLGLPRLTLQPKQASDALVVSGTKLLSRFPRHYKKLCEMYRQDYDCLGFSLPSSCSHNSDLDVLFD
jgi:hypothetical protein